MKDCTLPIMLLTKLAIQSQSGTDSETDASNIFTAFVDIFIQCDSFPAALTKILIPVIDR